MGLTAAEHSDEYKGNQYTLNCIKTTFLIALISWGLNVAGVFIIDDRIMNISLLGGLIFLAVSHGIGYLAGLDKSYTKYLLLFCLIAMLTFFGTMLSYHTTMFMLFPMVYSVQYHSKKVTAFIYVLTCIGFFVTVFVGFQVGICDANMLLLTTDTTPVYIEALQAGDFTINTDYFVLFLYYVFPRCMILTALIPLLNYIAREMENKTEREIEARRLVEIDGLTGLYNRNKYLDMVENYYPGCKNIAVVYCDLNNLKVMNDSKGHESGDQLLIDMADVLRKFNNKKCLTYRIGGDEFVMILENPKPHQAEQLKEKIQKDAEEQEKRQGSPLSVAVGLAEGPGSQVEEIIHAADEQMYAEKAQMKQLR